MTENILAQVITLLATIASVGLVQWFYNRKILRLQQEAEAKKSAAEAEQAAAIAEQAAKQAAVDTDNKVFESYVQQLDRMNSQIEFKDKRIEDLNAENADKEKRFIEQTKRLRESQDNEQRSQLEINRLNGTIIGQEQKICQLELELKDVKCHRLSCLDRMPKNDHTRQAEADVEAGAPIEQFKQSKHRRVTKKNESKKNSD